VVALAAGLSTVAGTLVPVASSVRRAGSGRRRSSVAQDGGAVIVWLKTSTPTLNLRTQSQQRIDAAHEDQNSWWPTSRRTVERTSRKTGPASTRSAATMSEVPGFWNAPPLQAACGRDLIGRTSSQRPR